MENSKSQPNPGALLIGSLPVSDTATAFRRCGEGLSNRLYSIPDGETGERWYFVTYQKGIFKDFPHTLTSFETDVFRLPRAERDAHDDALQEMLEKNRPLDVMYDRYAIESYQTFKRLRDVEKVLDAKSKFQVSLPTPTNTLGALIVPEYRMQIEPFYNEGLIKSLHKVQDAIPSSDLTIQIDMAVDMGLVENIIAPWWDLEKRSLFDGVIDRALIMASLVKPDVRLGFHLCYGDVQHTHFHEPKDLGACVKVILAMMQRCPRPIDYFHVPIPIDRDDDAYFAALADFEKAHAASDQPPILYLGLVHANDPEGTKKRINTARKVLSRPFGVATECGIARTPPEDLTSIFEIMSYHTSPIFDEEKLPKKAAVAVHELEASSDQVV